MFFSLSPKVAKNHVPLAFLSDVTLLSVCVLPLHARLNPSCFGVFVTQRGYLLLPAGSPCGAVHLAGDHHPREGGNIGIIFHGVWP